MERFGYSTFCDDIRFEVGNKLSFIGCYNGTMMIEGELPLLMPKFCIATVIKTPIDKPFEKLEIVLLLKHEGGEDELNRIALDLHQLQSPEEAKGAVFDPENPRYLTGNAQLIMTGFPINKAGILRVIAETESVIIRAGGLMIQNSAA